MKNHHSIPYDTQRKLLYLIVKRYCGADVLKTNAYEEPIFRTTTLRLMRKRMVILEGEKAAWCRAAGEETGI